MKADAQIKPMKPEFVSSSPWVVDVTLVKRTHVTSGLTKPFVELKLDNAAHEVAGNNQRNKLIIFYLGLFIVKCIY